MNEAKRKKEEEVCSSCRLRAKLLENFRKEQALKLQYLMRIGNKRLHFIKRGVLKIFHFFQKSNHSQLLFIIILLLLKSLKFEMVHFHLSLIIYPFIIIGFLIIFLICTVSCLMIYSVWHMWKTYHIRKIIML